MDWADIQKALFPESFHLIKDHLFSFGSILDTAQFAGQLLFRLLSEIPLLRRRHYRIPDIPELSEVRTALVGRVFPP
jgi:hypothetical protein